MILLVDYFTLHNYGHLKTHAILLLDRVKRNKATSQNKPVAKNDAISNCCHSSLKTFAN